MAIETMLQRSQAISVSARGCTVPSTCTAHYEGITSLAVRCDEVHHISRVYNIPHKNYKACYQIKSNPHDLIFLLHHCDWVLVQQFLWGRRYSSNPDFTFIPIVKMLCAPYPHDLLYLSHQYSEHNVKLIYAVLE